MWKHDFIYFHKFGTSYTIPIVYPIKGHSFNSFVISAHFAVCSFSSKEVLSELVQPPGPHCSSPSRVPPATGTIYGLLVDRQKGGSLQFLISCSGKGSLISHKNVS